MHVCTNTPWLNVVLCKIRCKSNFYAAHISSNVQAGPTVKQSPKKKKLELDGPQHDCPIVGVIAQQHSSANFKSLRAFQKILLFQPFYFSFFSKLRKPEIFNFKFRNSGSACLYVSAWDYQLRRSWTNRFICGGFCLDANLLHSVIQTVTGHRIWFIDWLVFGFGASQPRCT